MTRPQREDGVIQASDIARALDVLSVPMTALEFSAAMWTDRSVSPRWAARVFLKSMLDDGLIKTETVTKSGSEYKKLLYLRKDAEFVRPVGEEARPAPKPTLTERNAQIIQMLVDGMSVEEIASALSLRPRTVKKHIVTARRFLGATSRAQMIARAVALGHVHVSIEHSIS